MVPLTGGPRGMSNRKEVGEHLNHAPNLNRFRDRAGENDVLQIWHPHFYLVD